MVYRVSVKFSDSQRYEFALHERDLEGLTPESARRWLSQQFQDMGCTPSNPTGKVLLVDRIVGVAKAIGAKSFEQDASVARAFAKNAVVAFEKNVISIDVSSLSVG